MDIRNYASATYKESHFYADGTSGDDANNGLTIGTPVKTFERVMAIIPDVIKHHTVVHLSGTINLDTSGTFTNLAKIIFQDDIYFILDGGDGVVAAAQGSLGLTITSSDIDFITVLGAGWAIDQWKGVWVKTADGQIRMIQSKTADTLVPTYDFSPAPSGLFDIVIPETTVTATSTRILQMNFSGIGYPYLQRINISGAARVYSGGTTQAVFSCLVSSSTSSYAFTQFGSCSFTSTTRDPSSPSSVLATHKVGCSFRLGTVSFSANNEYASMYSLIAKSCVCLGTAVLAITNGCRFGSVSFDSCSVRTTIGIGGSGRKTIIDGSAGVGMTINSVLGEMRFAAGLIEINNCASHGIEIINSNVQFLGTVTGTGNAGAGVYVHTHSALRIKSGVTPTITGTVGELSTDGTTQASTWAAVAGGTPVVDLLELCTIKAE